ncbi:acyl-CoA thioesterase [Rhodovulum sp. PH10]|uniref:acyl-CoA thioesterase n=1 Tax=Rhodovulum sp. PH10 TaxID=1187851 RepID=UPI0012F80F72|nr:acyl-CoA thioesterase [Rhodovulum sp. PH10]
MRAGDEGRSVAAGEPAGAAPFVHRVTVGWGDCDPAEIAYTPRIPAWALEALEAFWTQRIGVSWYALHAERGLQTPFAHLAFDFRAPVTPRLPLDCEVVPTRLGEHSITYRVRGRQDGRLCFEGELVSVFVASGGMVPHRPPDDLAQKIRDFIPSA